jgi:hypothetical protein
MAGKRKHRASGAGVVRVSRAADELGLTRPALFKLIREGLPATRQNGRAFVDVAAAREWIAARDAQTDGVAAPALDPRDPRHRERAAAPAINSVKLAIAQGRVLRTEDAVRLAVADLTAFREALSDLASRFGRELDGMTGDRVADAIAPAVEEVTRIIKGEEVEDVDNAPEVEGEDDWLEGARPEPEPRDVLPRLMPGDPRFDFASASADARGHQLAELESSLIDRAGMRAELAAFTAKARDLVRSIPFDLALKLGDSRHSYFVIAEEIRMAAHIVLCELSGSPEVELASPAANDLDLEDCCVMSSAEEFGALNQRRVAAGLAPYSPERMRYTAEELEGTDQGKAPAQLAGAC